MHLNVSYRKDLPNWGGIYRNLFTEVANSPWLCWAMNEPSDNKTAKCLWFDEDFRAFHREPSERTLQDIGDKGSAIHAGRWGFEMRIFDMARSERDLLDAVALAEAMHRRAADMAARGETVAGKLRWQRREKNGALLFNVGAPPKNKTEEKFKSYIKGLGLRWADYRRFAQRNLRKRLSYGKKYLN
jgi:hypothetical protein